MSTDAWSGPWSACSISGPTHVHGLTAVMLSKVSFNLPALSVTCPRCCSAARWWRTMLRLPTHFSPRRPRSWSRTPRRQCHVHDLAGPAARPEDRIICSWKHSWCTGASSRNGRIMPSTRQWFFDRGAGCGAQAGAPTRRVTSGDSAPLAQRPAGSRRAATVKGAGCPYVVSVSQPGEIPLAR